MSHVLLLLSIRIRASGDIGVRAATFARPAEPAQVPRGPVTYAVTPGASPRATRSSRILWRSGLDSETGSCAATDRAQPKRALDPRAATATITTDRCIQATVALRAVDHVRVARDPRC